MVFISPSYTVPDALSLVSAIYDYAASGAGTFSFAPITDFKVAGSEDTLVPISGLAKVTVDAGQVSVDVADVTKREMHEKRATASCSNTSQRSFISSRQVLFLTGMGFHLKWDH